MSHRLPAALLYDCCNYGVFIDRLLGIPTQQATFKWLAYLILMEEEPKFGIIKTLGLKI